MAYSRSGKGVAEAYMSFVLWGLRRSVGYLWTKPILEATESLQP